MSTPQRPLPGKLILSVLAAEWDRFWPEVKSTLVEKFGKIDYESEYIPFTETSYYDSELGKPIFRKILAFEKLLEQNRLPEIKLATNILEEAYSREGKRLFNLDPGFITHERLVLATGKNFTHRVYLDQGIWADLTLIYSKGDWQDMPWTFPDYAAQKTKTHLRRIRDIYSKQIKDMSEKRCG
jgi:hypothetical protein